jgi:hypothetical protein
MLRVKRDRGRGADVYEHGIGCETCASAGVDNKSCCCRMGSATVEADGDGREGRSLPSSILTMEVPRRELEKAVTVGTVLQWGLLRPRHLEF